MYLRNKKILDLIAYTTVFCICYMVFVSTFAKDSAIRLPFVYKQTNKYLLQQGWAFFTRDSREPSFNLYEVDVNNSIIKNKIIKPNTHYNNLFGVSRKSRSMGQELSFILSSVKNNYWRTANSVGEISLKYVSPIRVFNSSIRHFKGNYVVIKEKRIPWVYYKNSQEFKYNIEYVFISTQ